MQTNEAFYRRYINCLNSGNLAGLSAFVANELAYNGREITLDDYIKSRLQERKAIPDLFYHIELLVTGEDTIACRLHFDCTPAGEFMGFQPNGNRITFSENVFYQLSGGKISAVFSLLDIDAIRKQMVNKTS
ncbi:ester cyclase [Mucilaginibacter gynuensis]|uniref:Ester cyclase n=1 Tax=Mucilaginibacter gynuensis TaxID=1302236 RepID=A0ABP8FS12_9SPHI